MVKYRILLTESEREELKGLLAKGRHAARKLTRARILLLSDEGRTAEEIAEVLSVGTSTVERIRRRCGEAGVAAALVDRPRPGAQLKRDERAQARLIAEACSTPPGEGRAHWPGRGVGAGRFDLEGNDALVSKKTNSGPGRSRHGAFPRSAATLWRPWRMSWICTRSPTTHNVRWSVSMKRPASGWPRPVSQYPWRLANRSGKILNSFAMAWRRFCSFANRPRAGARLR